MLRLGSVLAGGPSLLALSRAMSAAAGSSDAPGLCLAAGAAGTAVPGRDALRSNHVLLNRPTAAPPRRCGAETAVSGNAHLVFFPGDIQNFQQEMAVHADTVPWQAWSLERVALILGRRFPEHHIWVIRASHMYLHKFSCYQNFVQSNLFGAPEHSPDHGALRHLRALLANAMERAGLPDPLPPHGSSSATSSMPAGFSLVLVGFSKGCVVLNQMVYELAGARADPELAPFLERVTDIYWLDGGHPGGSETWVTEKGALAELAVSGVALHVHVTPYEVRDPMRAWVGREHKRFTQTLEDLGAKLSQKLHFEDKPASIENHFRVIQEF
uniref:Uncharacterized protein n=1 Tax=Denticeps clupeoides TaxID=299321 RepID=A0AAY4BAM0_9TELE